MVATIEESIRAVARLAEGQHGAFSTSQALALGMASTSLRRRALRGFYEEVHEGVFVVGGSSPTWNRAVMTAVLSEGDLTAASHQTAAYLFGLVDRPGDAIHVVTTRWLRRPRPDVLVHESTDLIAEDIQIVDGIPVTGPTRTVVDLGATAKWLVSGALGSALRRGLTDLDQVEDFVARVARRGRRGVGVIRPLIEARRGWEELTESDLEDRFALLVRDFSLPKPVAQFSLHDNGDFVSRADFAYPAAKVLIELDGYRTHADERTFQRDRTKQNRAVLLGWTVLRYTWSDILDRPAMVAAEILTVLA